MVGTMVKVQVHDHDHDFKCKSNISATCSLSWLFLAMRALYLWIIYLHHASTHWNNIPWSTFIIVIVFHSLTSAPSRSPPWHQFWNHDTDDITQFSSKKGLIFIIYAPAFALDKFCIQLLALAFLVSDWDQCMAMVDAGFKVKYHTISNLVGKGCNRSKWRGQQKFPFKRKL